jgi:hypothetical protein
MSRLTYKLNKFIFVPALAFLTIILAIGSGNGQSNQSAFTFRPGQSMYIVAYCTVQTPFVFEEVPIDRPREYINPDLDVERKIRKDIEEWNFFKVSDKPSQADFIFLVNRDGSSMEGIAVPYEAYRLHFKEKYDLDALRDAAFGRYAVGPLNIPTLSRLSDRLVKQFREKVGK